MKNFLFILFAFCTLAPFTQSLQAQTISPSDQKGIEACYTSIMSAFEKLDASGIGPWLTENAEQITPEGNITRGRVNVVANMAAYMEFLKTQPKPDKFETKNLGWQSRYLAPDVILATYTEQNTLSFGAQIKTEKTTTAVVLKKTNDKWLADLIALTPVIEMPQMGK